MARNSTYLVDPCGEAHPPRYRLAQRREIPRGAAVGLLDNGKTNVGLILKQVGHAVAERFGLSEVIHFRKPAVAHPCPEHMLLSLQSRCAAIINGVGD